ncbi:helix-turn-helix domain-containing protein [Lichenicola cladoniae]|uniref:Helix-turn-helix domain-containing protein n=1 Tax=Lichenicola cladoniae TaxID=1484109 RepID=A0A6M8HUC1_9PROT|nr:helix-turn-helix domain-containing protein [Lichenicola cladoniae]NPD66065.1 helix-turn-helix domain-containing protein [Acetobacteraceae bacterium]QKE91942.1 helix-turn-helix domain-containing protein [Lichenicola cladoniae]
MQVSTGLQKLSYNVPDALAATGIGRTHFYKLMANGDIPAVKSGRRTLIPAESLRSYLERLPPAALRAQKAAA